MVNAISVDVEEYFQATNLERVTPPRKWASLPARVGYGTRRALDLFSKANVRATFFLLGCVARRDAALVKLIAQAGHEIASHGYSHRLAYEQTPQSFFRDIRRAKLLLEDLSGMPVNGYRAPNFSITSQNSWAYKELVRAGYIYDSSLYPIHHSRYGNACRSVGPEVLSLPDGQLIVLPLAVCVLRLFGRQLRLPVAGGAYWRHFPTSLILAGLKKIHRDNNQPFICYFHPWELDPDQPVFYDLPWITRLRHYGGIRRMPDVVGRILRNFDFAPLGELAKTIAGEDTHIQIF
jgi:polysaccharide deacetylase family protein (PEP-CTERM system associated)